MAGPDPAPGPKENAIPGIPAEQMAGWWVWTAAGRPADWNGSRAPLGSGDRKLADSEAWRGSGCPASRRGPAGGAAAVPVRHRRDRLPLLRRGAPPPPHPPTPPWEPNPSAVPSNNRRNQIRCRISRTHGSAAPPHTHTLAPRRASHPLLHAPGCTRALTRTRARPQCTATVSNIAGPQRAVSLAGQPVEDLHYYGLGAVGAPPAPPAPPAPLVPPAPPAPPTPDAADSPSKARRSLPAPPRRCRNSFHAEKGLRRGGVGGGGGGGGGAGLFFGIVTYNGAASAGVTTSAAVCPEPAELARHWAGAWAELRYAVAAAEAAGTLGNVGGGAVTPDKSRPWGAVAAGTAAAAAAAAAAVAVLVGYAGVWPAVA